MRHFFIIIVTVMVHALVSKAYSADSDYFTVLLAPRDKQDDVMQFIYWKGTVGQWEHLQKQKEEQIKTKYGASRVSVAKLPPGKCGFWYYETKNDGTKDYFFADTYNSEDEAEKSRREKMNSTWWDYTCGEVVCSPPRGFTPKMDHEAMAAGTPRAMRNKWLVATVVNIPNTIAEISISLIPGGGESILFTQLATEYGKANQKAQQVLHILSEYNKQPEEELLETVDKLYRELQEIETSVVNKVWLYQSSETTKVDSSKIGLRYYQRAEVAFENKQSDEAIRLLELAEKFGNEDAKIKLNAVKNRTKSRGVQPNAGKVEASENKLKRGKLKGSSVH